MTATGYPLPEQLPKERRTLDLVVLLSGGGTTMANLADTIAAGKLDARIRLVVSSRKKAAGIERAKERGLPVLVLPRTSFVRDQVFDPEAYTIELLGRLAPLRVDLLVLAGFMSQLGPSIFPRHPIVNIHPALLPKYGGKGMYGHHVHEAVLAAGEKMSGCTVHFVDPEYDHGPILAQREVEVLPDDTPETLADRVQAAERMLYPEALGWIGAGRVMIKGEKVIVLPRAR